VGWLGDPGKSKRDALLRDSIWTLDLNTIADRGDCRLVLSAQWRKDGDVPRPVLFITFWLDWWMIPPQSETLEGTDIFFEVPLESTLLDKSAPNGSSNPWSAKRGEGAD
jgi:hypothetical protein